MNITNVLASVAVKEWGPAIAWYERLLGRPADSSPDAGLAEWQFERGGRLQVYRLAERAGAGSFTLAVTSLEDQTARLEKLGIDTRQRASGEKVKTLMIADPDGNHIAFVEAVGPSLAE